MRFLRIETICFIVVPTIPESVWLDRDQELFDHRFVRCLINGQCKGYSSGEHFLFDW